MQDDEDNAAADIDPLANMKSPSDFAGQQLFIQGDDWHNNAMLGWTHFPWDIYAAGYKDAADALVRSLSERKAHLDSVVYPLVFLYRQGLELQLKLILPLARRLVDKEAVADHQHGLMPLWNELRRHLQQLDPREDDKAIWKATVASDAGWSHSFTFLKLSPALIWEAADRPAPFAGQVQVEEEKEDAAQQVPAAAPGAARTEPEPAPSSAPPVTPVMTAAAADSGVGALLDLLDMVPAAPASRPNPPEPAVGVEAQADHNLRTDTTSPAPSTPPIATPQRQAEPSGEEFLSWLAQGVRTRKLIINDAKALVHTVAGTAYLVSPGVFQRYAQEHPRVATIAREEKLEAWQWVQKHFEKLGVHQKQASGLNIWTCEVTGPRKSRRLHGYLLARTDALFGEMPPDNPYLRLANEPPTRENYSFERDNDNDN